MKYLNFFTDEKALALVEGSPVEDIDRLEKELGVRIPEALREYLQLMGVKQFDDEFEENGTNDMKYLHEWIYEEFAAFRAQGYALSEIKTVLPFAKAMDNFFYVPVEDGVEDPPVMTLVLDSIPNIRKYAESVTDFVESGYKRLLNYLNRPLN